MCYASAEGHSRDVPRATGHTRITAYHRIGKCDYDGEITAPIPAFYSRFARQWQVDVEVSRPAMSHPRHGACE